MTGKSHTDPAAKPFALNVMQHMNDACTKWKNQHNIDFSLYGTPLESTTYKFAKCLQKRFGLVPGIKMCIRDRPMTIMRFMPASMTALSVVNSARNCRPKTSSPPPRTAPRPNE